MMKLKNKINKKKWPESTKVNLINLWLELWDWNNTIKIKLRKIMKLNSQSTYYWKMNLKKKSIKKEQKKNSSKPGLTR
jgi:hypothetical protein